ncbi:TPA: hypothetical protein N0F65_002149 [Lagenidium giganteum]|uniref:Calmodulin n=1 Tax=Lagenidium giganteum TaxID=4803 RepID=A0AAV2YQJ7_9STRA|nr:TPA: hypothetical protein N0F65_002149 [Lagenidium giganteum]
MLEGVRGTPLYTAPEVLYTKYSFPSDMWSCGVILYRLLTGRFPFQGELLDERIRYEEIDFESEPWPRVTKEAKDLVRRLLERDVDKRLTAEQALRHPWLAAAEHQHHDLAIQRAPLNGTMVQRLQFYRALNGFQQSVLYEIACLLPLDMKQDVIVLFGEISVTAAARERGVGIAEFAACFEKGGYTITYGEAKSFLSRLDLDGDGLLSIDEFCTAFLDWAEIQRNTPVYWEGIVNQVFDSLDQDGDGKLTVHDIARQLKPVGSINNSHHSFLNDVKRCFQQTDLDSDGWIDRSEFQAMVHVHEHAYSQYTRRLKRGGSPQMNNQV